MLEPGFYPHAPSAVELRETHISWVFLAGDLAYKVKKPLVLPFLDYGTFERRREMCREELRLNRRLAPRIYLRVVGVARDGQRWSLTAEDDPAACEYAVEMRRVEERRSLAALAAAGRLGPRRSRRRLHCSPSSTPGRRRPPRTSQASALEATLDENAATLRDTRRG